MKYGNCRAKCPILNGVHQSYNAWLYAGQSQGDLQSWKFLKFLKYFDLHQSPVEATSKYSDSIFPVYPTYRSYPPCKYEGVGMHSLDRLVCQSWGKYRWNMVIAGQNSLNGVHQSCNVWLYADQSQRDVEVEKSWNLKNILSCIRALLRQPVSIVTLYFLCLSYVPIPTHPVNRKSWTCTF